MTSSVALALPPKDYLFLCVSGAAMGETIELSTELAAIFWYGSLILGSVRCEGYSESLMVDGIRECILGNNRTIELPFL